MTHSPKCLYRIVAIDTNSNRTVMLPGLEFLQAIAARDAISDDGKSAWYRVEREPETGTGKN